MTVDWGSLQDVLGTVGTVVGILSGIGGLMFGIVQQRGRAAERGRADRAEEAQQQIAAELAATREALGGSRLAQERLADLESLAIDQAQHEAVRARSTQRQRDATQKFADQRQERETKSHNRKMLAEAKKHTQELKRQGKKR